MTQVRHPLLSLLLFCALPIITACNQDTQTAATSENSLPIIDFGHAQVEVELAIDRNTQAKGLMYRKEMAEDHGMLFIFDQPKEMSFWMRNTHLPLDIGYLTADGVLREVYPLYPHDETSRKSIRTDLKFALEVNQGWFARHNVKPGDAFDLEALR
ncbi:MAG: DUF192 domain-containing protein [Opitutales bacterium]|nr:DUF192 domain-containing protein [Opitutales bacterium]